MDNSPQIKLPIRQELTTGELVELDWMLPEETETVRALLNQVILEGETYPQLQPVSEVEFAAYWLVKDAFVVRERKTNQISGAFYLKPNFPGRCSHICNAGFIVQPEQRGKGIGKFMGEKMLEIARWRGYIAVMFNLVFETNIPSVKLWQSLGFETIGRIPAAAHLKDGRFVNALMLYRKLSPAQNAPN
ncbi:GNAT family N-acetyltransferase [[Phormidium] sp. LEGE 05292]|uniref:GNAT family N-acetyltransferase n=1 Tax=[Phormidium] sp. LEGE 05292 TaxID=767427 RepID=UPI001D153A03|nr:N-acetyltransferase [Phormidium sp. LEGE 05292]